MDYRSLTTEELKGYIEDLSTRTKVNEFDTPDSIYEQLQGAAKEYNSRVPKKERINAAINPKTEQLRSAQQQLPSWSIPKGTKYNLNPPEIRDEEGRIRTDVMGYVDRKKPTEVNIFPERVNDYPNVLSHEVAHTKQNKQAFPPSMNYSTGGPADPEYGKIVDLLKGSGMVAGNFSESPREVFANIEAERNKALKQGKPLYDTAMGKALGLEQGSDRLRYIYGRTNMDQPQMYAPEPTLSEKVKALLDKYRDKIR